MNSIQIFACDHRKNVQWDLPYIRIGSKSSDAKVNIKNDNEILKFDPCLSEGAQILYVAKHFAEFGNPDYVGFCHYRRFFSFAINKPIVNIPQAMFKHFFAATPIQIANYIAKNQLDGITLQPFNIVSSNQHHFVDIIDQLKFLMIDFNCEPNIIDDAFNLFLANCNDLSSAIKNTFNIEAQHVCNIFILESSLFKKYANIVQHTFSQLYEKMTSSQIATMHPRFMGYVLERFTSCYIYALQSIGKKINYLPLLTIDAHLHEKWEKLS